MMMEYGDIYFPMHFELTIQQINKHNKIIGNIIYIRKVIELFYELQYKTKSNCVQNNNNLRHYCTYSVHQKFHSIFKNRHFNKVD